MDDLATSNTTQSTENWILTELHIHTECMLFYLGRPWKRTRQVGKVAITKVWAIAGQFQRLAALAFVTALTCGCTTIRITDKFGATTTKRSFGIARIEVNPDKGIVSANVMTVGYTSSPLGYAFGYLTESVVIANAGCRAIFWVTSPDQAAEIHKRLGEMGSYCSADQ